MKFGKFISSQTSEWSGQYMSYKALKKIINSLAALPAQSSKVTVVAPPPEGVRVVDSEWEGEAASGAEADTAALQRTPREFGALKTAFFYRLERELEKVNTFYLHKEAELKVRLRTLMDKKKIVLGRGGKPLNAASLASLREAFLQYMQELTKLQRFVEINQTGFRKILKKWDKRSKSSTKELYLSRQVEIQACFNKDVMSDLTDMAATHLAELDTLIEQLPSTDGSSDPYPPALPQGHSASPADVFTGITEGAGDWESAIARAALGGRVKEMEELLEQRKKEDVADKGDKQENTPELTPSMRTNLEAEGSAGGAASAAVPIPPGALEPKKKQPMPPTPDTPNLLSDKEVAGKEAKEKVAPLLMLPPEKDLVSRLFYRLCPEAPLPALQALLKTGEVNPNFADDISSRCPLHELAIHGRTSAMEMVFDPKINTSGTVPKPNPTDIYGRTPLHYAAMYGRNEIASFLIRNGATVEFPDHDGVSPLIYAVRGGHSPTVQTLLNAGASVEPASADAAVPLCLACEHGHLSTAEVLLSRGARADVATPDGLYPLHLAAREGRTDIALALLKHGAPVDPRDGYDGWTPLFHAAAGGHRSCAKVLLDHGADKTVVDDAGWNCWSHALYRGHIACAKLVELVPEESEDDEDGGEEEALREPSPPADEANEPDEFALDEPAVPVTIVGRRLVDTTVDEAPIQPAVPQEEPGATAPLAPSGLLKADSVAAVAAAAGDDRGRGQRPAPAPPASEGNRHSSPSDTLDLDVIPHLSLPPPIVPFRIYGHNYLDKRIYFQIKLGHRQSTRGVDVDPVMRKQPLSLFGSRQLSSLKLIISTKPDSGIPYNIILPHPPKEDTEPFTFLVDKPPALQFDIFPTFGTKVIARGVCLPTVLEQILREGRGDGSTAPERCVVPLVDTHLRVLGELCFEVSAVTPFKHSGVEIGGKVETYWKSTRVVTATGRRPSEGNQDVPPTPAEEKANFGTLVQTLGRGEPASVVQSFVTASSLAEEYVVLAVQLTRDGVPVVCSDWTVPLAPGIALQLAELTAEQFSALPRDTAVSTADDEGEEEKAAARLPALGDPNAALGTRSSPDLAKMVYASRATLAQVLAILPQSVGVNILIRYPTDSEKAYLGLTDRHDVNTVVDAVLKVVYDSAADSQRSIIFSSFNPAVCTAGNWKQPNYAVFFCTHAGYRYMPSERPPGSNVPQPLPYGKRGKKDKGKKGKKKKAKGKKKGKGKAGEDPADAPGSEPEDAGADEEEIHEADDRCTSIKEAIRFAKSANLLGIVCDARPLVQVPSLIGTIKEGGLLLATFGEANADPENVRLQESCGVDAIMVDNVFKYNVTS